MIGKAAPGLEVYELKVVDGYRSDLVRVIRVPQDARLDVMAELVVRAVGISGGPKWFLN